MPDGLAPDISGCSILVVDDGAFNRTLIAEILGSAGFTRLTMAGDGVEALEQASLCEPDIAIVDLAMPRMDGIELCRHLTGGQLSSAEGRLPVLIQTAFDGPDARARAFAAGACDFITKPILRPELLARVRLHLENRLLLQHLSRFHDRVALELAVARAMQRDLLPTPARLAQLAAARGLDIAAHVVSSSELGGDFWDVRELDATRLAVLVADAAGHGVMAALSSMRIATLLGTLAPLAGQPAALVARLSALLRELLPEGHCATLLYGIIDTAAGSFRWCGAGATAPVLIAAPGAAPQVLDGAGLPLGAGPVEFYHDRTVALPPGALLLLYSDAMVETPDAAGAVWDSEAVAGELAATDGAAAARLARLVAAFAQGRPSPPPDDLTVIAIQRER